MVDPVDVRALFCPAEQGFIAAAQRKGILDRFIRVLFAHLIHIVDSDRTDCVEKEILHRHRVRRFSAAALLCY